MEALSSSEILVPIHKISETTEKSTKPENIYTLFLAVGHTFLQ